MMVVALAFAAVVPAAPSAAQSIDEARSQREANRAEQAEVAKQLDVLHAQESEIRSALDGLDLALGYQQGRVDAARQALHAAQLTAADSQHRYEVTTQEIGAVQARAQSAVVDAYIGGVGSSVDDFLAARDATEASQRRQFLEVVRGRFSDDLDQLRVLRQDQARAKEQADASVAEAAHQQQVLSAALAELDAQRAAQARLEEGLRAKIGDYQARADQLQAAEDELTGVINQHLAEEAAAQARAAGEVAPASVMPKLTASSASGFIMPTNGELSSSFGYRRHPILGTVRLHAGTDLGASYGTPIWAAKDGEVIFAGWNGGYGNCVIVAHEGGISTLYGHQSEIAVSVGQQVSQGEIIGYVGSTGQSTGPHLHFEVRVGGEPEDPMLFL
jgi:murein DD-endopeptidase MepM/ murein hydrolase activator NlpD